MGRIGWAGVVVFLLSCSVSCESKEDRQEQLKEEMKAALKESFKGAMDDLVRERQLENEVAAIQNLRSIHAAQEKFKAGPKEGAGYAQSLAELSQAGLIDNVLGYGAKSGYFYTLAGDGATWHSSATPVSENTGTRNFFVTTDGAVRFAQGETAAEASSPKVE